MALFLLTLMSGCAWHHRAHEGQRAVSSECPTPASCNYNGQYEPGERDYAEQEARRLNQAETQRLKRPAWW